ncbi:MAG: TlpA family protein disulfide reductase [Porphyromonadaceae bacterium]|nr:MAG: TlpA family protein disulfide reductase [Porphyromonadaceae bacterium]
MKKLLSLLIVALIMQTAYSQTDKDTANLLKVGSDIPEFTVKTLDGKTLSSDDLYGKVVLINFFATWCRPCNQELPLVEKDIWAKYKDNKDFVLVIIDRAEKAEVVKAFVEKKKWTMPFYLDEKKEVYSKFATRFIPRNYLFDREGTLVLNSMGFKKEEFEVLKKEIDDLLKKQH